MILSIKMNELLSIEQGDVYGLIDQNGAGKTTLLRLINGLMKPTGAASNHAFVIRCSPKFFNHFTPAGR